MRANVGVGKGYGGHVDGGRLKRGKVGDGNVARDGREEEST